LVVGYSNQGVGQHKDLLDLAYDVRVFTLQRVPWLTWDMTTEPPHAKFAWGMTSSFSGMIWSTSGMLFAHHRFIGHCLVSVQTGFAAQP
jgi:hypothetical protein